MRSRPIRTSSIVAACTLATVLLAAPALASHLTFVGVRATVTSSNATTGEVDMDFTAYKPYVSERRGTYVSSYYTVDPQYTAGPPAIDWGDGSVSTSVSLHIVTGGVPVMMRSSFSHTYGSPGGQTIRVSAPAGQAYDAYYGTTTVTRGPTSPYGLVTGAFNRYGSGSFSVAVTNTTPAFGAAPAADPCAYNPFHGFLEDGDCLPLCLPHPFHPELFTNVPCLAGCSVDETGATVGTCVEITSQPPAGSGPDPLAACLVHHTPAECQGLATGNGSRLGFDEPEVASAAGGEARGSSGGGCAVAAGDSGAASMMAGLAFVATGLALLRRRSA